MCTYVSSCSAVVAVSASSPRTSSSTSGSCEKEEEFCARHISLSEPGTYPQWSRETRDC